MTVKDVIPSDNEALQDVEVNNEASEITLYVEKEKLNANGKLDFTLLNLDEGITFTGNDNVTGTRKSSPKTSMDVKVPAKLGDYIFTLTSDNKVQTVTVHVIDATMPTEYVFRSWRNEDISSITDEEVRANTDHVKTTSTELFKDSNEDEPKEGDPVTFKGNVNTMQESTDGGKYYRVRVKVEGIKASEVKAVSQDGKTEYKTAPVSGNDYELYVYLNANEAETKLVLANKNASAEQIEKESTSCHTVKFESTSKIWLRNARAWNTGTGGSLANADAVTKAEVNAKNNHVLDIGVKFDELKGLTLKDNDGAVEVKEQNGDLWLPVVVIVGNQSNGAKVKEAVFATDSDSIMVDRKKATKEDGNALVLWVKSNGEESQEISFTLKYNRANEPTEELPVTVILHNASAPKITNVLPGDDANAKALQNYKVTHDEDKKDARVRRDAINVDVYKHGMKAVSHEDYTGSVVEGRWYSLKLEFNVPVENILFNNSGNAQSTQAVTNTAWQAFEKNAEGNTLTIWLNADDIEKDAAKTSKSVEQTLCNKWTIEEDGSGYKTDGTTNEAKWTVGVTVNETEASRTALHHEVSKQNNTADVWEQAVKDSLDSNELKNLSGIDIETIKEDDNRKSSTKTANYGTFAYTLDESKDITITNAIDPETDIDTATISLNSAKVSDISLTHNNKKLEGRWILVHFAVRGDAKYIVSKTDSDAIIIDTTNRGELLSSIKTGEDTDRIPLWINLDAEEIQAATKHSGETKTPTPFKVTFGSNTPVEEENYFYILINDTNANSEPIPETAKPSGVELGDIKENDSNLDHELQELFPNDNSFYNGNPGKAFVKNMELLEKADVTKEIVGDTVYVTIKDDFKKYYNKSNTVGSSNFNIAFDLDLSSLGLNRNDTVYFYNDGTDKWISTNFDAYPHIHFGITIQSSDYTSLTNSNQTVSKEYIFSGCNGQSGNDCTKLTGKYIRYVFTFVQDK